jgi:Luciferase-like monooxygenase
MLRHKRHVGGSNFLFWPVDCPRGDPVVHRGILTMEAIMADPIQISLRIPGTSSVREVVDLVQEVEAAGFAGVGILDSQLLCRDVFVTMAAVAMQTAHITIFPAVTNPFTRHASVLASAIQSVEELAPAASNASSALGTLRPAPSDGSPPPWRRCAPASWR